MSLIAISLGISILFESPTRLSPFGFADKVLISHGESQFGDITFPGYRVIDESKDAPPEGFQFLKNPVDEPTAGMVGIYVPAKTGLAITGRYLRAQGTSPVTLRLAKSKTRESRSYDLKPGSRADYNEWRRCAIDRASSAAWPPAKPGAPFVSRGTLVIVGGGGMTPEIAKAFVEAGGGEFGKFVDLPISMPDPINLQQEEAFLRSMGVKNLTVIPYRDQETLESPKVMEVLKNATGIWFGGGRQWNFVDAYEGTKLPAAFREVLNRNGVIGGSSAGATILGDYMVRGAPAGPTLMMCEGYERALGFLPGVAIDQHFTARNRFKDMTLLMKTYPQFLGIGLDEATAIVVRGSTAEVMGRGNVHFYDTTKKRQPGELDYEAFGAGTLFDLVKRTRISH